MSQEDEGKPAEAAKHQPAACPQAPPESAVESAVESPPETPAESAPITAEELAALPPVEELTAGSDLRPFLRPGVPAALKNAAMRRMWLLNPVIRDHADCAVDYAWDWNTPGGVPGSGGRLSAESTRRLMQAFGPSPKPANQPPEAHEAAPAPKPAPAPPPAEPMPASPGPDISGIQAQREKLREKRRDNRDNGSTPPSPAIRPRHGGARPR